jgi:F-type H+-transporting ATPase subunit delta
LSALTDRYAAALADVAVERHAGDAIRNDLSAFVELFSRSPELHEALDSPVVEREVKHRVIAELCAKMGLNEAVRNFIYVVVDHGRLHLLNEIVPAFRAELNERLGIADAEVTSAHPFSDADKRQLVAMLEKRTGKKIVAQFSQDAALVGGAVVRVGSTIYDGSVREQLNRLREQLESE